MKNLITIAVVVAIALVAFNYFQSGEFKLMPGILHERRVQ